MGCLGELVSPVLQFSSLWICWCMLAASYIYALQAEACTLQHVPGHPQFLTRLTPARLVQHEAAKLVNASLRGWVASTADPRLHYCTAGDDLSPDLFPGG